MEIEEKKIDDEANRNKVIDDIREAYEKLADVKAVWENQMRGREETEEKERERRAYYRKIYKDQIRKNLEKLQAEIKAKVNAEFKAKARIEAEAKARIQAERKRKKTESELMEIKKNRIPQFCRCKFLYYFYFNVLPRPLKNSLLR